MAVKSIRTALLICAGLGALASACERTGEETSQAETATVDAAAKAKTAATVDYDAIVASPERSDADRARDAARKPAESLAFFQIKPGQTVFEIEAGGGYFTEIYSLAVGPQGSVVMQNFQGFADYAADEIAGRFTEGRLVNVRRSISLHDDLDAADDSVDVATWVQGPHELYYKPAPDSSFGDPAGSFAEIYRIVKPGGVFAVIDHAAEPDAPTATGNDLHRIDKSHVIALAEAAGFALEAESDFLANPEDDRTLLAFDPIITGKTDQFALRFRKPE